MSAKRIAYLRGSFLNPFESQYLIPIKDEFKIVMAYPKSHRYNI